MGMVKRPVGMAARTRAMGTATMAASNMKSPQPYSSSSSSKLNISQVSVLVLRTSPDGDNNAIYNGERNRRNSK